MKTIQEYPETMTQAQKRAAFAARKTGINPFICYPVLATVISTGETFRIQQAALTNTGPVFYGSKEDRLYTQFSAYQVTINFGEEEALKKLFQEVK